MSAVIMGMAEIAFQVAILQMEWPSVRMTKITMVAAVATIVQPLMDKVVEVLGGGRVVDTAI